MYFSKMMKVPTAKIKQKFLKLELDLINYHDLLDVVSDSEVQQFGNFICFANVHMVIESYKKPIVAKAVNSSGYTVTDGVPLIAVLRMLYGIKQERIAGMDFMPDLMRQAEINEESVFFYGGTDKTLKMIISKAKADFPRMKIAGTLSPPFRELRPEEHREHIKILNDSGAKYIFIGLGCPKQELWMASNHKKVKGIMLGVGAAFEIYSGEKKLAPDWMRRTGTEWIFRLMQEPGRLFKRYLFTNTYFIFLVLAEFVKIKILGRK